MIFNGIWSQTNALFQQSWYLWKVVLLAVRVLLVIVIELVIIFCRKILIWTTNVLLTLLDGFHYHWRIPKTVTIMNGNMNQQDYGKEKLIKTVLQMRWNITEIQSPIVHSKHNMQSGTSIQLCLLDLFRNKLLSYRILFGHKLWNSLYCQFNLCGLGIQCWLIFKELIIKDTTFFERHTCVPYGKAPAWEVRLLYKLLSVISNTYFKLMDKSFASSHYKVHSPKSWNWYLVDTLSRSLYFWSW